MAFVVPIFNEGFFVPIFSEGFGLLKILGSAVSTKSEKAGGSTKFELSFMNLVFAVNNV